jgi:hypothetical protein
VLTADAQEQLRLELKLDGLEEAGALYGNYRDGELVVEAIYPATLPGRTSIGAEPDFETIDQLAEHFAGTYLWLGDYHTHTRHGQTHPSRVDCEGWITRARASRVGVVPDRSADRSAGLYAGLIISPGGPSGDHWIGPTLSGWLVHLAENGDHHIRQVEVIEETPPIPLKRTRAHAA